MKYVIYLAKKNRERYDALMTSRSEEWCSKHQPELDYIFRQCVAYGQAIVNEDCQREVAFRLSRLEEISC